MIRPTFALRLLAWADDFGGREPLVGDLVEEIARGRSSFWVWQQLLGLCGFALAAHARKHGRLTPLLVALAVGTMLLGAVSITSFHKVLETWLLFYLVAGTVSLFAHVISRTTCSSVLLMSVDSQQEQGR